MLFPIDPYCIVVLLYKISKNKIKIKLSFLTVIIYCVKCEMSRAKRKRFTYRSSPTKFWQLLI